MLTKKATWPTDVIKNPRFAPTSWPLSRDADQGATERLITWATAQCAKAGTIAICVPWQRLREEILPVERRDLIMHDTLTKMGMPIIIDWHRVPVQAWDRRGLYLRQGNAWWSGAVPDVLHYLLEPDWWRYVAVLPRRSELFNRRGGKAVAKFIGSRT